MDDKRRNLDIAQALDRQHPNPWTPGHWYPAEYNGVKVHISRSNGRGRNSGTRYLHVKRAAKTVIKSPSGEVLREALTLGVIHVIYNMQTGEAKEV